MRFVRRCSVLAAIFAIAAAGQTSSNPKKDPDQIGTRDVSKGVNWYSIQKELALGKALAAQIAANSRIVTDPVVSEYVNRLAQNLARNSDAKFPLQTQVLEDDSLNALSLPGGYFFVNTGLILGADSEAELAGGMAHEIAHIAARHATRQATRAQIGQLATIPLIFMGGMAGYGAQQGARVLLPMGFLKLDRDYENEADLLGLEYLYKSGYDPAAMVDMLEKIEALQAKEPGKVARLVATHPATSERISATQKNIQELLRPRPEYVVNTSEFVRVKARLMAIENRGRMITGSPNRPTLRRGPDPAGHDPRLAESLKRDSGGKHPSNELAFSGLY